MGREDSAPKSFVVAEAEAINLAEGSIQATNKARVPGTAGVSSPGHAFKGFSRNLGDLLVPSCKAGLGLPDNKKPGRGRYRCTSHWSEEASGGEVPDVKGNRRRKGKGKTGVLRTHITGEGGECRGRSGRPAGGKGGTNERIGWRKHEGT